MYNDKKFSKNGHPDSLAPVNIEIFEHLIGKDEIEELKQLAAPLENRRWSHVNSTYEGGGVAEMLQNIVPIARGLGLRTNWLCLEAEEDFFITTKKLHNAIQGVREDFHLQELFDIYIETNKKNFNGSVVEADLTIVHDPQPCASIIHGSYTGKVLWRCHIDTTAADQMIWNFLLPYINNYDGAIFSLSEFIKNGLRVPTYTIAPSINPLSVKNKERTKEQALNTLEPLLEEHRIDPERPIILAVSRYDIHKNQKTIVRAFQQLKRNGIYKKLRPQLVLVGNLASDDPEGQEMYDGILRQIDGDNDIFALLNIENNDENIGALMRIAGAYVHVSTKEGFGLVVTEAMWQGTPVIGSNIGGIKLQVLEGKTGFLVDPNDVDKISEHMSFFLRFPEEREKMGALARRHVGSNFLITHLLKKYLKLMRYVLGIEYPHYAL